MKKPAKALMVVTMRLRVPLPEEDVGDLAAYYRERLNELLPWHLQPLERYEGIEVLTPVNVHEDGRWRNAPTPKMRPAAGTRRWGPPLADETVSELRRRYREGEDAHTLAAEIQRSYGYTWKVLRGLADAYAHVPDPIAQDEWRNLTPGRPKRKATDDQATS